MAHQLQIVGNEAAMFYVGQTPWHGLGYHFVAPPTTAEALDAAKLNWEVGMRPLFNEHGVASTHRETFRSDTGATLGVVGPRYHPLQNTQAFNFFDPLVQDGTLAYETAGVLNDGKRVWILAKVAGAPMEIVKNDAVERFVMLSNSHDGSMAIRVGFTAIRVVCANTLAMAHAAADAKLLRINHTTNADVALGEIRKAMNVAGRSFQATAEQYRLLAKYQVNASDIKKYVQIVFDLKADEDRVRDSKVEGRIFQLFESGKGMDISGVKGTAWAMYQAVTEYLTHEAGRSVGGRFDSLYFGQNANRNKKALELAVLVAKAKAA